MDLRYCSYSNEDVRFGQSVTVCTIRVHHDHSRLLRKPMLKRNWLVIAAGSGVLLSVFVHRAATRSAAVPTASASSLSAATSIGVAAPALQEAPTAFVFRPEDGQTMAYQYDIRSKSDVDVAYLLKTAGASSPTSTVSVGERQKLDVSLRGILNLKFFDAGAAGWNVSARTSEFTYLLSDQPSPESGAMEQPFAFSLKTGGSLDGFVFAPGVSPKAQSAIRQILSWFQVIVPNEPNVKWFSRENDATGTFRAQYVILDAQASEVTLSKSKTHYASLTTSLTPQTRDTTADIVFSEIQYRLPRVGSWINTVTIAEELALSTRGRPWGKVASAGSIQRLPTAGSVSWPATFDAFQEELKSTKYLSSKFYETDPTLDALWGNLSTSVAVERFVDMWSEDPNLAEALMVNFLRQKPSRSAELVRLLDESTKRNAGIDDAKRLTLWRLNAKAGHKEAQKAQLDAALNSASSRTTRMNALAHLDFENPEPFVVDKVLRFRRSSLNAANPAQRELGTMALLSLGALGDASHPNQAMSDEIEHELVSYLDAAKEPSDIVVALQAIGNSGRPEAINAVVPYLDSTDESIRVNALEAFRRMNDPQAASIVMQQFDQDASTATRAAALRSLSTMTATSQTMTWGREALTRNMAGENLAQLAAWLGGQIASYPANEAALRQLLQTSTSFEVKKSILRFIAP